MRRVALALVVVNLLFALWFLLRPSGGQVGERDEPRLLAVSEVPGLKVRPDASCLFVGPVTEARVVRDLQNLHAGWQEINRVVPGELRYRVYVRGDDESSGVAAPAEGQALLAVVRSSLQEVGLEDVESYLMGDGEFAGFVSLGLFAEQDNAQRLLSRLQENGVGAELAQDPQLLGQSWLVELSSNVPSRVLSAMENLILTRPDMRIEENLCEMFALRE